MNEYNGGCHCGNIRYVYATEIPPGDWSVRRCTCRYCLCLAARYTSSPGSRLDLTILYASMVQRYEFATRTAEFMRCGKCGVMICALCNEGGRTIAALNVNTLDQVENLPLAVVDADFDGEQGAARLGRRAANWIPQVRQRFVNA